MLFIISSSTILSLDFFFTRGSLLCCRHHHPLETVIKYIFYLLLFEKVILTTQTSFHIMLPLPGDQLVPRTASLICGVHSCPATASSPGRHHPGHAWRPGEDHCSQGLHAVLPPAPALPGPPHSQDGVFYPCYFNT